MAGYTQGRSTRDYINPHKAARIIAAHGGICHLCGHPGATEVDHIVPWAEWTRTDLSVHDKSNLAPAHGSAAKGKACPTCGVECHVDKSKAEAARGSRRSAARRAAAGLRPTEPHPGRFHL